MTDRSKLTTSLEQEFSGRSIYTSPDEVPADYPYPSCWQGFGISPEAEIWLPAQWSEYKDLLPITLTLLQRCLIGTVLLAEREPSLIYIFEDTEDYYYYIGGAPLSTRNSTPTQTHKLPRDIRELYLNLHNGFTFHPSNSMGPLPVEQLAEILDLYDGSNPGFPSGLTGVLHNGAGDYLCIIPDTDSEHAAIWWHELPDRLESGIDFWDVMDTWISIFLEDIIIQRTL